MTIASHRAGDTAGRPHDRILISGAGVVGLALAVGLARTGWTVTLVGPHDASRNGRTVALLDGSVRMLGALGVWADVERSAAPLAVMRLVDDTGSLFRGPPVEFRAAEVGLPAFGYNVENAALLETLERVAREMPGLERVDGYFARSRLDGGALQIETEDGVERRASLLVAADGAGSPARTAAGLSVREVGYPQIALTAILRHQAPHGNVSTEFHTRQGPFTLVPMPPDAAAPYRSSLVWVMAPAEADRRLALDPAALAREIDVQSRLLVGRVAIEGRIGRFPIRTMVADRLTGDRVVLVGEAAHALPPIGAQGLNLSLRDAATLVDHLAEARARRLDPGGRVLLDGYERSRRGDIALRAAGVDALNRSLLSSLLPVDLVRTGGLAALSRLPAARRIAMRYGLMPRHAIPSLMQ